MKSSLNRSAAVILLAVSIIAGSCFLVLKKKDHRTAYEEMLRHACAAFVPAGNAEAGADQPEMAALQDFFMTLDPATGRVPRERYRAAMESTLSAARHLLKSSSLPLQWEIIPSNMGGRVRCITLDPGDPSGHKVWAGAVTGGLWKHNDITEPLAGWEPVDDFWPCLSVSAIAFDPNDPQVAYVGTGEAFTAVTIYRESSGLGAGIFKSTDGGTTWAILPSSEDFKYVTDIEVVDNNGSSVIYAGVVSGIYKGQYHQSMPNDGLYRSMDGGQTWMQVLPLIPGSDKPYAPSDIEIGASGRIFVGTMRNLDGEGAARVLRSDSGIIGTWSVYDDYVSIIENDPDRYIPGRVMLAAAPSDPDLAYALFDAGYVSQSTGFILSEGRYILRTTDRGETWYPRNIPTGGYYYWATLGWHALTAAVNPVNPDHLYVGGLDTYQSFDGGSSWVQVSDWTGMYNGGGDDYVHADIHDIDFMPGSPNELLISTDGGVFYTSQASSYDPAFQEKNRSFGSLQFYTCDIHPTAGFNRFVGGLQDNGTLYYTGSPLDINQMIDGGDGAYCFIDENEPQYMITSYYYNNYTLWVNGYDINMSDWSSGIFINPADLDYRLNILYCNATTFGGSGMNQILRISGIPDNISGTFLYLGTGLNTWFSHVRYSPHSPVGTSTLFLGSASGRLFKVMNAQSNPTVDEITGGDFPAANISCVALGGSEDTILVTFSNYGVPSVWQTYDGGDSWVEKEGNLPDMPIRWALYHPLSSKHAMLATETGIWTCDDLDQGAEWFPGNEGLAKVRIDMLQMRSSDQTVLAATHGRGLATATWDILTGIRVDRKIAGIRVYPNPSGGTFWISWPDAATETIKVTVTNLSGQKVFQDIFTARIPGGEYMLGLEGCSPGEYFLRMESGHEVISQNIIIR
jgi:photosystem II stability/assembly factor-like uncharacterized protein